MKHIKIYDCEEISVNYIGCIQKKKNIYDCQEISGQL